MQGEIGDLEIRPATPPTQYEDFTRSAFRGRALSTITERQEHETPVVTSHVSVEPASAKRGPRSASYLIYQDRHGVLQQMLLSVRQERLLYEDGGGVYWGRGRQIASVQGRNGTISLRRRAFIHVYNKRGAVYTIAVNRRLAAAIWDARDRSPERAYWLAAPDEYRCPRGVVEHAFGSRPATPYPGSNPNARPAFFCGFTKLSVGPLIVKLRKKTKTSDENKETRHITTWVNNAFTSYFNRRKTFATADIANTILGKRRPRLSARNLKAVNRRSHCHHLERGLGEGDEESPEFHRPHNRTTVYGDLSTNSNFNASKRQRIHRKVKKFFKRSIRAMDLVRRKSRSAMQRITTRRDNTARAEDAAAVAKIEAVVEWVMTQPNDTYHEDGVVALTEENLARLRVTLDEEYQVVMPNYLVPPNSRATSVSGDATGNEGGEDNEGKGKNKSKTSGGCDKAHDNPKRDDDGDENGGFGGQGATQGGAAGNGPNANIAQNEVEEGAKETTKSNGDDKAADNDTSDNEMVALIEVLLLAQKRDPNDIVPHPDFLELMEAARKARLAERFGPRVLLKRTRQKEPMLPTQPASAETGCERAIADTKTVVPEQIDEKHNGQEVEAGAAVPQINSHVHPDKTGEDSHQPIQKPITSPEQTSISQFISPSYEQDEEVALRAIADQIKRGDEQFAQEKKIKDLREVKPVFLGFYMAAPNLGQSMIQLESNYSSWFNIPLIDPRLSSTVVLGRGLELRRCDTPLSEGYNLDDENPFDTLDDDDLPILTNPPRAQAPAQALILHLLFKGHAIDDIATQLSCLDEEFLYVSESRFWNRVRVPQLWQLNEPAVRQVLVAAQSSEKWWEKTTDPLGTEIPISLRIMQNRMRANKVKHLARMAVENYFWWRFMGQRIHDIPTGFVIREYDN